MTSALVALVAALMPVAASAAPGGNCDAILGSAANHDIGWKNWDGLIDRATSAECEYSDIDVAIEAQNPSLPLGFETTVLVFIKNVGTAPAVGMDVSVDVSPRWEMTGVFQSLSGASGFCDVSFATPAVSCQLDLAPGGQIYMELDVTADNLGDAVSTVNVNAVESGDLDPRNNSDATVTTISLP